jgi:Family of unknown function (DUF6492)
MSGAFAILTPSYAADFARCQLLCESMDAMAEGGWRHYILVADHDLAQFRPLAGSRRSIIPDSVLLPPWMKAIKRPFDRQGRHVWISTDIRRQIRPLSGWHVQQLRKLAAAAQVDEDVIVMADSDSVFIRPFGLRQFVREEAVRLYLKPNAIPDDATDSRIHAAWVRHAAQALGLPPPSFPADDFINNLVSWRKDRARALISRIEAVAGLPFALALGRAATLSEYQIYGAFTAGPGGMAGHFVSSDALSHTYWSGGALTGERLDAFLTELKPHQVALCIQSFTDTPLELLRDLFRLASLKGQPSLTVHT